MATVKIEDSDRIKRPWTPEEDEILQKLVQQHGVKNWAWISRSIPARCRKSCRMRWCNQLSPVVEHRSFTAEEDEIILNKQAEIGNKGVKIAKLLNGRSENAVKKPAEQVLRRPESVDVSVANEVRTSPQISSLSESEIFDSGNNANSDFPMAPRAETQAAAAEEEIADYEFNELTLRLPETRNNSAANEIGDKDSLAANRRRKDNGKSSTPPPKREKPLIRPELVAVMKEAIRMEVRNYLSGLIRKLIRRRKS